MSKPYTLGDFRQLTKSLPDDTPVILAEQFEYTDELLRVAFVGVEVHGDRVEIGVMIEDLEFEEDDDED